MCGIVGIVSGNEVIEKLYNGLSSLEYRGYDSVGISTISKNKFSVKKDIGKLEEVNKKVNFLKLKGTIGLGHCRWSTHGGVTRKNSHPHFDCKKRISLVHNGIIENYSELKDELLKKGHRFDSETDTEVIAHLIEEFMKTEKFEEA